MTHILTKAEHNYVTKTRVITVISLEMKHLCSKLALDEARATMLLIWWSNLSDLLTKINGCAFLLAEMTGMGMETRTHQHAPC